MLPLSRFDCRLILFDEFQPVIGHAKAFHEDLLECSDLRQIILLYELKQGNVQESDFFYALDQKFDESQILTLQNIHEVLPHPTLFEKVYFVFFGSSDQISDTLYQVYNILLLHFWLL